MIKNTNGDIALVGEFVSSTFIKEIKRCIHRAQKYLMLGRDTSKIVTVSQEYWSFRYCNINILFFYLDKVFFKNQVHNDGGKKLS